MTPDFNIGNLVEKHTGDYRAKGEVQGVFTMSNGAVRYVVEHKAEGGGSFFTSIQDRICDCWSARAKRNPMDSSVHRATRRDRPIM
jgi:hypothetical protein